MKTVLFLVHRIPFPPDKGDKIRSFHVLKKLASHYKVFLGTFIDDPHDLQYQSALQKYCAELHVEVLSRPACIARAVLGIAKNRSVTASWYQYGAMRKWVDDVADRENLCAAIAFSSGMAQFLPTKPTCPLRIMEFVDLDSAKWRQLASKHHWPKSLIYAREANLVSREEKLIASKVDLSTFVSEEEAELLRRDIRDKGKVMAIRNGINSKFFDPEQEFLSPFPKGELPLVFTGAMDYWANVEAVSWFAKSIFPRILNEHPQARFYVVGARPTAAVSRLAKPGAVVVTGRVKDVRPFLSGARVVVAPLLLARGVQNKVLEGMAMAKPVVVTSAALEGIGSPENGCLKTADSETEFAAACGAYLSALPSVSEAQKMRQFVVNRFSWESNLEPLIEFIETSSVTKKPQSPA